MKIRWDNILVQCLALCKYFPPSTFFWPRKDTKGHQAVFCPEWSPALAPDPVQTFHPVSLVTLFTPILPHDSLCTVLQIIHAHHVLPHCPQEGLRVSLNFNSKSKFLQLYFSLFISSATTSHYQKIISQLFLKGQKFRHISDKNFSPNIWSVKRMKVNLSFLMSPAASDCFF